jgi:hypothetical protein
MMYIDGAEFVCFPGSQHLMWMHTSHPGVLGSLSSANMLYEEVRLKFSPYSVNFFFGALIHHGGNSLISENSTMQAVIEVEEEAEKVPIDGNGSIQWRVFSYCDANDGRESSFQTNPDNTYTESNDHHHFFRVAKTFLKPHDR